MGGGGGEELVLKVGTSVRIVHAYSLHVEGEEIITQVVFGCTFNPGIWHTVALT